ncbi:hypothetical protein SAMN06269173_101716 [Hymenobacter mucosus]|uniref:Uncharacterized protein n=1 Tax=Hymenobacter mucosus TaxID=1411120 RepID=A0A238VKP8_9BACT|nr:hypothetical protein SAMN06269173_101716 [Hymenobacter mucosus]
MLFNNDCIVRSQTLRRLKNLYEQIRILPLFISINTDKSAVCKYFGTLTAHQNTVLQASYGNLFLS